MRPSLGEILEAFGNHHPDRPFTPEAACRAVEAYIMHAVDEVTEHYEFDEAEAMHVQAEIGDALRLLYKYAEENG